MGPFPTFADQVLKFKDSSSVAVLFARLETEDNPFIYLKATEVLLAFDDKAINRRIVEISKRNTRLTTDWGRKSFAALLKPHGVGE
jgi:hypothetical protein